MTSRTFTAAVEGRKTKAYVAMPFDPDIAAALDASPQASAAFDALAQFYRKAFLKWIDGTKKRPDERARRITHMVSQLEAGNKTR